MDEQGADFLPTWIPIISRIQRSRQKRTRTVFLSTVAALGMTCAGLGTLSHANTTLPTGFGAVTLGMSWNDAQSANKFVELTRINSDWERHVYDCGYRHAQLTRDDSRLLVTAEDFMVMQLSYVTSIKKDSNLMQVAKQIIDNYGEPNQATMRDELGAITIEQATANYVTLVFDGATHAKFMVSGTPLWEYRISIEDANLRGAQNRTVRCARAREKQLKVTPRKKAS